MFLYTGKEFTKKIEVDENKFQVKATVMKESESPHRPIPCHGIMVLYSAMNPDSLEPLNSMGSFMNALVINSAQFNDGVYGIPVMLVSTEMGGVPGVGRKIPWSEGRQLSLKRNFVDFFDVGKNNKEVVNTAFQTMIDHALTFNSELKIEAQRVEDKKSRRCAFFMR